MFRKLNLDALGVTASILCAIHCAVLPLVVASLPILGINILRNSFFEYGMIALAFVIGTAALWHGFRRHHHRPGPWLLFTGGMSLLIAKEIWPDYEPGLLPFAVLLIVGAHWLNYRWCRKAGTRKPDTRKPDTRPRERGADGPAGRGPDGPDGGLRFPDFPDPASATGGNLLTLHETPETSRL